MRLQIIVPALVLISMLAALLAVAAAGAFYLRQPSAFRASLLGDAGRLVLPESPAIAVLPFDDMSATGDQQYLADGITEELITGFAKFPEYLVMSRNATLVYKDKPTDIRQVGKDLNVRYVVEGTTQRSDQNVRVTAQLTAGSEIQGANFGPTAMTGRQPASSQFVTTSRGPSPEYSGGCKAK